MWIAMTPAKDRACVRVIFILLLTGLIPAAGSAASAQSAVRKEALQYRLAFDSAKFTYSESFEVSPDGRWAAYVIQHNLADATEAQRIEIAKRAGIPHLALGSRLHISDMRTARTFQVCPGEANTWLPSWSKDGQTLAFYSDAGGVAQLWSYAVKDGKCRRVSAAVLKPLYFVYIGNEPKWSADGRTIFVPLKPAAESVEPQVMATPIEQPKVLVYRSGSEVAGSTNGAVVRTDVIEPRYSQSIDIGAIDVATGKVRVLVDSRDEPRPRLLRAAASGNWVSYVSLAREEVPGGYRNTMDLAVVRAAGGKARVVGEALPEFAGILAPVLNYSWHPSEDRLVFTKNNRLWLVDLTGEEPAAARELAPELGDIEPTLHWFTRDGRYVIAGLHPQRRSEQSALFAGQSQGLALIPLEGGRAKQIKFDTARWDYEDVLKANATTLWQPDHRSITVRLRERSTGENAIVRIDPDSGKQTILWKGLARIGGGTGYWQAGDRQEFLAGVYEDYATPADIYRFSDDFSSKHRISHLEPRLDSVAVGKVEMFETPVPLYDGRIEKVRTAVLLPQGMKRGERRPGIVLFYPDYDFSNHAERFGGDVGLTEPALLFTSRGYVVLLVHAKIAPFGQAGNPMKEMTDTLLPQVYRAAELGYVDAARLGIRGNSYGGYGVAAVVSYTNLFRAAVPSSGPYDIPGEYGVLAPPGAPDSVAYYESGQGRMGASLWNGFKRYIDNSPYYQADKIFTPLLIMQGSGDSAVGEAQKLFVALRRLNKPAQLAIYAGEGHAVPDWSVANAVDGSKRIVQFFDKYLGAPQARNE